MILLYKINGGRGQGVKAVGCDSTIRGFKSRRSPIFVFKTLKGTKFPIIKQLSNLI